MELFILKILQQNPFRDKYLFKIRAPFWKIWLQSLLDWRDKKLNLKNLRLFFHENQWIPSNYISRAGATNCWGKKCWWWLTLTGQRLEKAVRSEKVINVNKEKKGVTQTSLIFTCASEWPWVDHNTARATLWLSSFHVLVVLPHLSII